MLVSEQLFTFLKRAVPLGESDLMEQRAFKILNNFWITNITFYLENHNYYWITNITFYLEISGDQRFNKNLIVVYIFNTSEN